MEMFSGVRWGGKENCDSEFCVSYLQKQGVNQYVSEEDRNTSSTISFHWEFWWVWKSLIGLKILLLSV